MMKSLAVFTGLIGVLTFGVAKADFGMADASLQQECRDAAVAKVRAEFSSQENYLIEESLAKFVGFSFHPTSLRSRRPIFEVIVIKDSGEQFSEWVTTQKNFEPNEVCFSL